MELTNHRVFGRKVESSLNEQGYATMLDGEYLSDSAISTGNDFILLSNLSLNDKAKLGAYGATKKLSELVRAFRYGQARRLSPPDDYRDQVKKMDAFSPEEYLKLTDFLK